ncbi:MAG TPA: hypothetical protein VLZ05_07555 [Mycobacterium sp.]|nr:hypothetical protein [Mycobacterium sp.]HUH68747.1 hypothetical protein [Mycobacterium sp.]
MSINADGQHRQPVLMCAGGVALLWMKSALCVLLFYCLLHGVDA